MREMTEKFCSIRGKCTGGVWSGRHSPSRPFHTSLVHGITLPGNELTQMNPNNFCQLKLEYRRYIHTLGVLGYVCVGYIRHRCRKNKHGLTLITSASRSSICVGKPSSRCRLTSSRSVEGRSSGCLTSISTDIVSFFFSVSSLDFEAIYSTSERASNAAKLSDRYGETPKTGHDLMIFHPTLFREVFIINQPITA